MSKYVNFEYVFDKYRFGFDISFYFDLKCLQIVIPFMIFTFNFSGDWAGSWKDKRRNND